MKEGLAFSFLIDFIMMIKIGHSYFIINDFIQDNKRANMQSPLVLKSVP